MQANEPTPSASIDEVGEWTSQTVEEFWWKSNACTFNADIASAHNSATAKLREQVKALEAQIKELSDKRTKP